jgi:accessory gene regulator protein AgrB
MIFSSLRVDISYLFLNMNQFGKHIKHSIWSHYVFEGG